MGADRSHLHQHRTQVLHRKDLGRHLREVTEAGGELPQVHLPRPPVRFISRRFVVWGPAFLALLYMGVFGGSTYAFVRLSSGAAGIFWGGLEHGPVSFVVSARGSRDIPDESDDTAFRLAFKAWNQVPGSGIQFRENTDPAQRARGDWTSPDIHLCFFDEAAPGSAGSSNFFPPGSGVIAVSPVSFYGNGQIADGDVIFNGYQFRFSTNGAPGTYDVQNIATHEVGHFLGLDHSAVVGSTMFPYADPGMVSQRSLQADDVAGVASVYPGTGRVTGAINGRLIRPDGTPVVGAHVIAVDVDGEPVASRSDAAGGFYLGGLPPGDYTVYAEPLDGPVEEANLQDKAVHRDFSTTRVIDESGRTRVLRVVANQVTQVPRDVVVGPQASVNVLACRPSRVLAGMDTTVVITGLGIGPGAQVAVSGRDVGILQQEARYGSITARLRVGTTSRAGLRNIEVTAASGEESILTGGLEISLPAPSVTGVQPARGAVEGGTSLQISGAGFVDGAEVTIGGRLATSTRVTGDGEILTTTPAGNGIAVDVVVINPDGQFRVLSRAFSYTTEPVIGAIEPASAPYAGGVTVTVRGSNFQNGATVSFGGQRAASARWVSTGEISVQVPGGTPGVVDVTIQNPDGGYATLPSGFEYAAPTIVSLDPPAGSTNGGTVVRITGKGFAPGATVTFGGRAAGSVSVQAGGTEVLATTPPAVGMIGLEEPGTGAMRVDVVVRNQDDSAGSRSGGFRYVPALDPVIVSVSPSNGPTSGGTSVSIQGDNFEFGAAVSFGGASAPSVEVLSATRIVATTPAHAAGTVEVVVRNPSTLAARVVNAYTFSVPAPMSASPAFGGGGGGGGGGGCVAGGDPGPAGALGHLLPLVGLMLLLLAHGRRGRRIPVVVRRD